MSKEKVRSYDIPSAFVNTDVDKDMLMVLKGELAIMMEQISPEVYWKYVTVDRKGIPMLCIKLQKVLYGLMRASLLLNRKLRKKLEEYGFKINQYDPCMANKDTQSGKQLTVIWHVDDLMASWKDNSELTMLLYYLAKIYGPKVTMHTGDRHDYLGMDIHFSEEGVLNVSMVAYLRNVINSFLEVIMGSASTPAADHYFNMREEGEARLLEEERALAFHHTMVQLLFMSM